MPARRQINRYKTEPYGTDYNEVLKKGKRFFNQDGCFLMAKYGNTWSALGLPAFGNLPKDSLVFRKEGHKWKRNTTR